MLIVISSSRRSCLDPAPGVPGSLRSHQMTADRIRTGSPTDGRYLRMAPPTAA
jgi:hypothetical protein